MTETEKKYGPGAFSYFKELTLPEFLVISIGYSAKAVGIFSAFKAAGQFEYSQIPFEQAVMGLGIGAFMYFVGHGIHSNQAKIQTYRKLDNIEKLLIEQNNGIKSIENTEIKGE